MTGTAEAESTAFEDREAIKETFPAVHHFIPTLADMESEFESPVTVEFAVEATARYQLFALLQLNQTGMVGRAALISAVDMHKSGIISRQRVTELVRPYHIKQLTSDTIEVKDLKAANRFCSGVSVLPRSAVSARVYFTAYAALEAKGRGEKVCLCKETFLPTDSAVMREMDAIISLTVRRHPCGNDLPEFRHTRTAEPAEGWRKSAIRGRPDQRLREGNQRGGLDYYLFVAKGDLCGPGEV